jgi:hypothetical protein
VASFCLLNVEKFSVERTSMIVNKTESKNMLSCRSSSSSSGSSCCYCGSISIGSTVEPLITDTLINEHLQ